VKNRWVIAAAAVVALISVKGGAQTMDRTKPPVSPEPRAYKLPPVFETKLPNGLTVMMAEDARVPLATVRLAFAAGNKRDPADIPGLAASTAAMLMQGTRTRSYQQIAEQLDSLGAVMNAVSGADQVMVDGSAVADNLPKLLELIADVARNATFPEDELKLHKQNRKQTLNVQHSQPAYVANEEFRRVLFGEHPYSHVGPTSASIDRMDQKTLITYRDTFLVPNNAFLIIVGKLPARTQAMKTIADLFGTWQQKPVPEYAPAAPPVPKKQLILVDRPGSVQADVRMGRIAANRHDSDYFPESVGSMILGAGPNSRLFLDIREKRGFAYDVHTETGAYSDAGTFAAVTQVRNEVAAEALGGIMEHLDRMAKEPVGKEELTDAKSSANGFFLLRLEPQAGLADQLVEMKIQNLPRNYLETYTTRINSVEPDQIEAAAKKYIATENDAIVVVGDAAKIGEPLSKLGKFEVVKPAQ
jgi:zinc protease